MKEKLTPKEKKRLSYEKDHRTRTGENERGMRYTWAKRKKRVNRKYRRKADAVLRKAISPERMDIVMEGEDGTTRELIRKGLTRENNSRKWGVRSLKQALIELAEMRDVSAGRGPRLKALWIRWYKNAVAEFYRNPEPFGAPELRALIGAGRSRELKDFVQENPALLEPLNQKLRQLVKKERTVARKYRIKEEEKRKWRSPTLRLPRDTDSQGNNEQ